MPASASERTAKVFLKRGADIRSWNSLSTDTRRTKIRWKFPEIACGAMAQSKPYVALPQHQEPLGFPGELVENWQEKAILKLGELVKNNRGLRVYLNSCVRCGACTDKCHYFMGTGDPKPARPRP